MKVFFVIDIKKGKVVAGKSGEREKYKSIAELSQIVDSDNPVKVIKDVKPKYLYAADLDRITGEGDNFDVLVSLSTLTHQLIADCGFRFKEELENLPFIPVVGTETYDITRLDRKCYVSLDFKGCFLDASKKFGDWRYAVEYLNNLDLYGVIVLPIHSVGTMKPDFDILQSVLKISDNPVLVGGGVSGLEDLERLKDMGCSGVLIATAVHRGRIPLDVVRRGRF